MGRPLARPLGLLLPALALLLLLCRARFAEAFSSRRLYPISGIMTAQPLVLLKQASSTYMVDHPEIDLSANTVAGGSAAVSAKLYSGGFDYSVMSVPPT